MRARHSSASIAPHPTYWLAAVASAAPATPQPRPNMRTMSRVKLTTLDSAADSSGVLSTHACTLFVLLIFEDLNLAAIDLM